MQCKRSLYQVYFLTTGLRIASVCSITIWGSALRPNAQQIATDCPLKHIYVSLDPSEKSVCRSWLAHPHGPNRWHRCSDFIIYKAFQSTWSQRAMQKVEKHVEENKKKSRFRAVPGSFRQVAVNLESWDRTNSSKSCCISCSTASRKASNWPRKALSLPWTSLLPVANRSSWQRFYHVWLLISNFYLISLISPISVINITLRQFCNLDSKPWCSAESNVRSLDSSCRRHVSAPGHHRIPATVEPLALAWSRKRQKTQKNMSVLLLEASFSWLYQKRRNCPLILHK